MKRFLPLALLLITPASFAVDGQVLINTSTIMASGGFPYKITQPGSYKLSGNLVGPLNTNVIQIASSNVTLDLNGFNISCSGDHYALFGLACVTDASTPLTGITVRNGSMSLTGSDTAFNFRIITGVSVQASQGVTLEDLHVDAQGTNYGFNGVASGKNNIIRRNIFTGQAGPNFVCPSLIVNNVNSSSSFGFVNSGCLFRDNIGFPGT